VPENDANKGEIAHRFSKVFIQEKEGGTFASVKELISDDDSGSDCEERREQKEQRRLEKEKRRKEKIEKQKKNIVKLTNFTSLRPSLAKMDMIRRLRRQRQYKTKETESTGPSEWEYSNSSTNQAQNDFNVMSL